MKKIYLIVGAMLWGGIVDAQTLSVEQYRQKVLEYNQDIQKSQQAVNGALYSLKGIRTGFFRNWILPETIPISWRRWSSCPEPT